MAANQTTKRSVSIARNIEIITPQQTNLMMNAPLLLLPIKFINVTKLLRSPASFNDVNGVSPNASMLRILAKQDFLLVLNEKKRAFSLNVLFESKC